jgi:hypothetical protein
LAIPLDDSRIDPPGNYFNAVQYARKDITIDFEASLKTYLKETFEMKNIYKKNQSMSLMCASEVHGFLLCAWGPYVIVITPEELGSMLRPKGPDGKVKNIQDFWPRYFKVRSIILNRLG